MGSKQQELFIPKLHFIEFDFLAFKKSEGTNVLHEILKLYANGFWEKVGFYSFQESEDKQNEKFQTGIVRINWIDWLDRTNYSMTFIAAWALYRQIEDLFISNDAYEELPLKEKFKNDILESTGEG